MKAILGTGFFEFSMGKIWQYRVMDNLQIVLSLLNSISNIRQIPQYCPNQTFFSRNIPVKKKLRITCYSAPFQEDCFTHITSYTFVLSKYSSPIAYQWMRRLVPLTKPFISYLSSISYHFFFYFNFKSIP